jgi:hypothetical protein
MNELVLIAVQATLPALIRIPLLRVTERPAKRGGMDTPTGGFQSAMILANAPAPISPKQQKGRDDPTSDSAVIWDNVSPIPGQVSRIGYPAGLPQGNCPQSRRSPQG